MKILLVAIGSGLGGVLRYLVPCWIGAAKGFPWATLTVNVVGSLLIGLLSGLLARQGEASGLEDAAACPELGGPAHRQARSGMRA